VRYIDSGRREPDQALGTWLADLDATADIVQFRVQTGFFSADGLAPLKSTLDRLRQQDQVTRLLIGSNDGTTQVSDAKRLVEMLGLPRDNAKLGVVSFSNAFFHPKVVHVIRADGSIAAYVGSANLTTSGVGALHVEAGLLLDSNEGDAKVLFEIMDSIDRWFDESPPGLWPVASEADVDELAAASVLGVPRPPSGRASQQNKGDGKKSALASLQPLVVLPTTGSGSKKTGKGSGATDQQDELDAIAPVKPVHVVATWTKKLSRSDAQRKPSGNQRGSITLVAARQSVDTQHFFRDDFFVSAVWTKGVTRTGQPREIALVPMAVSVSGVNLGIIDMPVSHAENREAGQNNYASLLHLGPLSDYFVSTDMTGKTLTLDRRDDGSFALTVA